MQWGVTLFIPLLDGQWEYHLIRWRARLVLLARVELGGVVGPRRAPPLVLFWERFWTLEVQVIMM